MAPLLVVANPHGESLTQNFGYSGTSCVIHKLAAVIDMHHCTEPSLANEFQPVFTPSTLKKRMTEHIVRVSSEAAIFTLLLWHHAAC